MSQRRRAPAIDLSEVLNRSVRVIVNGESRTMAPFAARVEQCVAKALRGDVLACERFLRWCLREGLVRKPEPYDDHQYFVTVPKDWDYNEFMKMYGRFGPPPWPGERDGLTASEREDRRRNGKRRRG